MEQSGNLERDGFQIKQKTFFTPADTTLMDPVTKRKITICNLFANHHLPIRDIVGLLDEKYGRVVQVLIEKGLVHERRKDPEKRVSSERRRSFFSRL
jgi:hypothetical protein